MWCRNLGHRALEEELRPVVLSPVPANMATPLERQMAETLGLQDQPHWPRLPMEVGSCEQGARCCWRWLARAALEEVAGEPVGHLELAKVVAFLKDEMKAAAELRVWADSCEKELEKAAEQKHELDKLQRVHAEAQEDLQDLRVKLAALTGVQEHHAKLKEDHERLKVSENKLQQEITRLKTEKIMLLDGELAAWRTRAENAEKELMHCVRTKEEHKASSHEMGQQLAKTQRELAAEQERIMQLKAQQDAAAKRRAKRKGHRYKPPIPKYK